MYGDDCGTDLRVDWVHLPQGTRGAKNLWDAELFDSLMENIERSQAIAAAAAAARVREILKRGASRRTWSQSTAGSSVYQPFTPPHSHGVLVHKTHGVFYTIHTPQLCSTPLPASTRPLHSLSHPMSGPCPSRSITLSSRELGDSNGKTTSERRRRLRRLRLRTLIDVGMGGKGAGLASTVHFISGLLTVGRCELNCV